MPIYGYRCNSCDHTFEVVQSVNDEPIRDCPECQSPVSKLFFPVGISFKGSGFYVNDYKSTKRTPAEKRDTSDTGNAGSPNNANGSGCSGCASSCPSVTELGK